jgi:hypothetical protein
MVLQSKIGLALLALGIGGLWYYSRKNDEGQETIDTSFEELQNSLLPQNSSVKVQTSNLVAKPASNVNTASLKADSTNSLSQPFTEESKSNQIETGTTYRPKQIYPDCSRINGFEKSFSCELPVLL